MGSWRFKRIINIKSSSTRRSDNIPMTDKTSVMTLETENLNIKMLSSRTVAGQCQINKCRWTFL
ncbi:hypothetical protein BpHYR1_051936 [Brachionus plicatilis]|uniref:Uncharacterized protein n=1 Tax=Brachionus plicatilis TaxID=10195 RepID=A0A3M7SH42_BRAPC|nr:hypothetical protein BpHYR1_051936 [Brachionus plicatilis]